MIWCVRKKAPYEPDSNPGVAVDSTGSVSIMPQQDIPWPSLADSPWPMYLHDPQHTSRSPLNGPTGSHYCQMGSMKEEIFSSPAITENGQIIIGADGLYAFDPSGTEIWHFDTGQTHDDQVQSSPLITSYGIIYFGCNNGYLYALRLDGSLLWKHKAGKTFVRSSPNISKDGSTVYVYPVTEEGADLLAIDSTGQLEWEYSVSPHGYMHSSPAVSPDGHTIYVTGNSALHSVSSKGESNWVYPASDHIGPPILDNEGNIYFQAGGTLYCVDPNGTFRWRIYLRSNYEPPCIGYDGTLYSYGSLTSGFELYMIDYSGKLIWKTDFSIPGSQGGGSTPSVDIHGNIFLGLAWNRMGVPVMNFISVNKGGALRYYLNLEIEGSTTPDIDTSPVIGSEGIIYVGSDNIGGSLFQII